MQNQNDFFTIETFNPCKENIELLEQLDSLKVGFSNLISLTEIDKVGDLLTKQEALAYFRKSDVRSIAKRENTIALVFFDGNFVLSPTSEWGKICKIFSLNQNQENENNVVRQDTINNETI